MNEPITPRMSPDGTQLEINLLNAQFSNMVYHSSLFDKNTPPKMTYIPSFRLLRKILNILGRNDTIEQVMLEFTGK